MMRLFSVVLALLFLQTFSHAVKEVSGIPIPENFEELVDPENTAVLVIDMQNGWASTQGCCVLNCEDTKPDHSKHAPVDGYAEQVKAMQRLLEAAREAGVLVTYAEFIHENEVGSSLMTGWFHYHNLKPNAIENTWDSKTIAELAPQKGDYIIRKSRGNAFYKTYLEDLYRERSIRSVILTGTATGGCVAASTFGAFERGFYPIMVRDCLDQHESLFFQWMEESLPMHSSDEIIAAWEKGKAEKEKDPAPEEVGEK